MSALFVLGLLTIAGMAVAFFRLGARFNATEDDGPIPRCERDTEPWPAPR